MSKLNIEALSTKVKDNKLRLFYEDIEYETRLVDLFNTTMIFPKYDLNNKKVPYFTRLKLKKYLIDNYDYLSIPDDMKLIEAKDIKKYISDLKLCEKEEKEVELKHVYIGPVYIILIVALTAFLIIEIPKMLPAINEEGFSPLILAFILPILFLLVLSYIFNKNDYDKASMKNLYSCQVEVYDKKVEYADDAGFSYVRVKKDNYIINKWFQVSDSYYKNGKVGTLYHLEDEDAFFEYKKEVE